MKRREVTFLIVALILGAVLGGLVGELVGSYLPEGAVKTLFTKSLDVGFEPLVLKLYAISLTVGLMFKINFVSVISVLLVVVYFKWWYI
ncbi:MAG: DUF4321 domain-containing protein [candidate division Zixibacteria bacterium]|nr:DUF4321 domain-containing protein [candidate division Zixibacteria bacterium]